MASAVVPPTIRPEITRVTALAPLPAEEDCSEGLIVEMDEATRVVPRPLTDEEALALFDLLATSDESSYYGVMWTVVHAVETAPGWPLPQLWTPIGPWFDSLRIRARNGGFAPPA
jgi:hypothetical protein